MKFHKSPPKEFWYNDCLTDTFEYEYKYEKDRIPISSPPMTPIMWFICVLH